MLDRRNFTQIFDARLKAQGKRADQLLLQFQRLAAEERIDRAECISRVAETLRAAHETRRRIEIEHDDKAWPETSRKAEAVLGALDRCLDEGFGSIRPFSRMPYV